MIDRRGVVLGGLALAAAPAAAAAWPPLLEPTELAGRMGMAQPRLLDIRSPEAYAAGHVAGAVSAPYGAWRGPPENPGQPLSDAALTALLRRLGVDFATPVVVIHGGESATAFGAAARAHWTLTAAGHPTVSILNGGFKAWAAAGLPVSTQPTIPAPTAVTASLSPAWTASRAEVRAAVESETALLVDARPEAFFRGEARHRAAGAAGALAGAVNFVHSRWFAPKSPRFAAREDALARARALAEQAGGRTIVSYCNTGHWAATNWFALSQVAGIEGVKLYPESIVGWTRAGLPVSPGG